MLGSLTLEAWKALGSHPLRTALAMLGMVVGVGSVVVMLAVAQGSQERVRQVMRSLGSNVLVISSGASVANGVRQASGTAPSLSISDAEAIASLPSIRAVTPSTWNTGQLVFESQNWLGPVQGVYPDIIQIRDWDLGSGAMFDESDVRSGTRKAVVGATVVDKLFQGDDPIGKTLRIRNVAFTVVGTLARKGQTLDGWDLDDIVYVPISTNRRDLWSSAFPDRVHRILVEAASAATLPQAEADIRLLLRTRHRIAEGAEDDFTVRRQDSWYETEQQTASTMRALLGAIASVSLLVGGIGIMNIMLVTVAERTREIGLRMAVGARSRDIALQFLSEAVVICLAGGAIGLLAGLVGAWIAASKFGMAAVVSLQAAGAAVGASALAGLFFGLYPALRASRLMPAEALRTE
jgi:putative ABC transport system permease protein